MKITDIKIFMMQGGRRNWVCSKIETVRDMPWHDKVQTSPLTITDGYFELPTSPGPGTDLDESIIKMRPYTPNKEYYVGSCNAEDHQPICRFRYAS